MPASAPNFSPFPFASLRRLDRRQAALESAAARWLAAVRPLGARSAQLAGGPVTARLVGLATAGDPYAALADVHLGGATIRVAASGRPIRALAQRLLGGPAELEAPRPPTLAEHAIWALVVAAAIDDMGIAAEVWPVAELPGDGPQAAFARAHAAASQRDTHPRGAPREAAARDASPADASQRDASSRSGSPAPTAAAHPAALGIAATQPSPPRPDPASPRSDAAPPRPDAGSPRSDAVSPRPDAGSPRSDAAASRRGDPASRRVDAGFDALEFAVDIAGAPMTVVAYLPRSILVRVPEHRALPRWTFDLPIVVARCALPREAVAALAVRDVILVDRELSLGFGAGGFGLRAAPGAIEATVATGYLPRDMTALDAAHLELTVQLGQIQMPLRQIADLAVGQVIPLGCPLAGPFEVRAQGRLIGRGELIDVDGELGVRIVSVVQE